MLTLDKLKNEVDQITQNYANANLEEDKVKFLKGNNDLMKYLMHCETFTEYLMFQLKHDKLINECSKQ